MGFAGAGPTHGESWGPALLSSQESEQNSEGRRIVGGKGGGWGEHGEGTFVLEMGLFCLFVALGGQKGRLSKASYSPAPQCQLLGRSLRPWQYFLCGRLKKGDVFALSVPDIKMRPPSGPAGSCSHRASDRLSAVAAGGGILMGGGGCTISASSGQTTPRSGCWSI